MSLQLILEVLSLLPSFNFGEPAVAPTFAPGAGTLMVVCCTPGSRVIVTPGDFAAAVDDDGKAKLTVPAQERDSEPYRLNGRRINGTVNAGEILVASCLD